MPAQPVYIHVGLPKTGTTHLQDRFWRNRDSALRRGLFYPGDVSSAHFHAAVHLQPERYLDWVDPAHRGGWERMLAQMRTWEGRSLISHELFSSATPEQASRVRADLDFADVHIVVTARDLGRQLPSVWQENIKNQHTTSFADFLAAVDRPAPGHRDPFWEFQDLPRVLDTWAADLPADRVHVVTVPPRGGPPGELLRRLLSVVSLTPADLPAEVPATNSALSRAQIEVLRRLNTRLQPERIEWARYERVVKSILIGEVLFAAPGRGGPVLPADALEWVTARAQDHIDYLAERGVTVVGDLAELLPRVPREPDPAPSEAELHGLAMDALADLIRVMPLPEPRPTALDRVKPLLRAGYRRAGPLRRVVDRLR